MSVWKDDWKNGKKADGSEEKSVTGMPGATLYVEPNFEYKPKGYSNNPEDLPKPKTTPETVAPKVTYGYDEDGNEVKTVGMPERPAIKSQGTVADKKDAGGVGTRYLNGAFGNAWALTPEEEEKRLRRMTAVNGARALGDSIMAFANSIYTGKGANSAQMPKEEMPDQMAFVDRVNAARKEAEARDFARKQAEAKAAYQKGQLDIKREELEAKKPYYQNQANAQEGLANQRETAADLNRKRGVATMMGAENNTRRTDSIINRNNAAVAQGWQRVANDTRRTNATVARTANGNTYIIDTPTGVYAVPKGAINDQNRGRLAQITGAEITNYDGKALPKEKQDENIMNAWNEEAQNLVEGVGGRRVAQSETQKAKEREMKGSAAAAQNRGTGGANGRTENTSSGTGTANGGTGTWGSSIKRKKK